MLILLSLCGELNTLEDCKELFIREGTNLLVILLWKVELRILEQVLSDHLKHFMLLFQCLLLLIELLVL